jgi:hypothetical protein
LIASVLALALLAMHGEAVVDAAEGTPAVELDPCLNVDESVVRNLVSLELRDVHAGDGMASLSVGVRCTDGGQEIRVEPWASRGEGGVRAIDLPAADDADPAAQEARSRELALAIAELIRRLQITHPLGPQPPRQPPPTTATNSANIVAYAPPPDGSAGRWRLGVQSSFESFAGGQRLAGGDLFVAARVGRWILADIRIGGRLVGEGGSPSVRITARAGTAILAGGLNLSSSERAISGTLLVRAQGYLLEYRAEPSGDPEIRTVVLGAFVVALEPRLFVALSRRVSLTAAIAAGLPVHGVVVRTQGTEADSLSGLLLSGNLGAVVTFDR